MALTITPRGHPPNTILDWENKTFVLLTKHFEVIFQKMILQKQKARIHACLLIDINLQMFLFFLILIDLTLKNWSDQK